MPQSGDLDRGVADRGAGAVHEHGGAGAGAEVVQTPVGRLHGHGQCGGVDRVESRRAREPDVEHGVLGRAGGRVRVGHGAEHRVADIDAGHCVAQRVDRAGHLEPDAAGQVAGEQAAAQRPVRRVQPAGLDGDADLAGAGARGLGVLESQDVGRVAVAVEPEGAHQLSFASDNRTCRHRRYQSDDRTCRHRRYQSDDSICCR